MLKLTVNNTEVEVNEGSTILDACHMAGVNVPTLCFLKGLHEYGECRVCVVEVEGARTLMASCITPAWDGMKIRTNTAKVQETRKIMYELMLSDHPKKCLTCARNQDCELQALGKKLGATEQRFSGAMSPGKIDKSLCITRDLSKCILCRRCVAACGQIQGCSVLTAQNRGFATEISPAMSQSIADVDCTYCGQCVKVCPTAALSETDNTADVWAALSNPELRVIVQAAPSVRVTLGEEFGMPAGSRVTGKLVTALKKLGFDDVFDTNFGADLTIMEEATEFLGRLTAAFKEKKPVKLPMFTSCSPGWVKFAQHNFPEQLPHLSTCKTPQTMLGAVIKSYYAKQKGFDPKKCVVVSVMPCIAKKHESARADMSVDGLQDVDITITVREFANMIKAAGIDFKNLKDGKFDNPLGISSGAGDIFGVTGGVMEAALRSAYEWVTGRELPFKKLHVTPIVGFKTIKEASIKFENVKPEFGFLEGVTARVAVASGLKGARKLMQQVKEGKSPYHFIEVMACPGGCIMGGGTPRSLYSPDVDKKRAKAIYGEDEGKPVRKAHENPAIQKLYADYLGAPGGKNAHHFLHTHGKH